LIEMPVGTANYFALPIDALAALRCELGDLFAIALQTADAFRPAGGLQVGLALFIRPEGLLNFYQAFADPMSFPGCQVHNHRNVLLTTSRLGRCKKDDY
jgi:hypothetical protein